jgi:hypothetical protein
MEQKPTYDNFLIKVGQLEHELSKIEDSSVRLQMFNEYTQSLPYAFVFCQILTGNNNLPADFKFITANKKFENYSNLNVSDIKDKKVTEIIPPIKEQKFDWISIMGHIAIFGAKTLFQVYLAPFDTWYIVSAFSPDQNYFVLAFDNITEIKQNEIK